MHRIRVPKWLSKALILGHDANEVIKAAKHHQLYFWVWIVGFNNSDIRLSPVAAPTNTNGISSYHSSSQSSCSQDEIVRESSRTMGIFPDNLAFVARDGNLISKCMAPGPVGVIALWVVKPMHGVQ